MAGLQTLGKRRTSVKQIRNKYKSYISDNFLITRDYKIRYTYDCRQKKLFQGRKTNSIFENIIFSQRDFVCWWNLHLHVH